MLYQRAELLLFKEVTARKDADSQKNVRASRHLALEPKWREPLDPSSSTAPGQVARVPPRPSGSRGMGDGRWGLFPLSLFTG